MICERQVHTHVQQTGQYINSETNQMDHVFIYLTSCLSDPTCCD